METHDVAIQILKNDFTARSRKNPRYSLRAYAKALGISHTVLSLVLAGKRPLSKKAIALISEKLALDPLQITRLMDSRGKATRLAPAAFRTIDMEIFKVISDWVHYAILTLIETSDFQSDTNWIADRLDISKMDARVCFERLINVNLIEFKDEKWRLTGLPIKVENNYSTTTTRLFQKQMIEKSLESLERDPYEIRDFSSVTLAMDPSDIPYARERIKQFRRELMTELEARGKPTEVYNLTLQIYPVSRKVTK